MKTIAPVFCFVLCLVLAPVAASADTMYVSGSIADQIVRYTNGNVGTIFAGTPTPEAMAFDADGNMYVPNFWQNTIHKIDPAGNATLFASTNLNGPHGAVFDDNGNLYIANFWDDTVVKFNLLGQGSVFADGNDGLDGPYDLAFDAAGNLFVSNELGNTVHRFNPLGQGSVFANSGLNHPTGLAFDNAGNLYVANVVGPNIMKFTPQGGGSLFASNYLSNPIGIAFDSAGTLFAANWGDNSIAQFDANGNGSYFATNTADGPAFITFVPDPDPIVEKYSLAHVSGGNHDVKAVLSDKSLGNGTAKVSIAFSSNDTGSDLLMRVTRTARPHEVVFALLVFRVEVRGYDAAGKLVYTRDLDGFTFGDSAPGRWNQKLTDLPGNVGRVTISFVGNYE